MLPLHTQLPAVNRKLIYSNEISLQSPSPPIYPVRDLVAGSEEFKADKIKRTASCLPPFPRHGFFRLLSLRFTRFFLLLLFWPFNWRIKCTDSRNLKWLALWRYDSQSDPGPGHWVLGTGYWVVALAPSRSRDAFEPSCVGRISAN